MANLRQRSRVTEDRLGTKDSESTEKARVHLPGISFLSGVKLVVATVVLVSATALLSKNDPGYLPASYALCSRNRKAIYAVDPDNSLKQCLVVHEERIFDTGDFNDVLKRWDATGHGRLPIRYIDDNSIVVPGISDSHCHILEYGASRQIHLSDGRSVKETVAIIADYILADPDIRDDPLKTVEGWGWDHTAWDVPVMPSAKDLDSNPITRGRSIILQSKDGHALWVSTTTLNANSPLPETIEGGQIFRDASGKPTGMFMDTAMDLIARPILTDADLEKRFKTTVREALSKGVTSLHDAGFNPVSLGFFKRKAELNDLPIRIYGMSYFDEHEEYWGKKRTPLIGAGNNRLTARSVKLFADGALRTGGAALYEPYSDNPSTNGMMRISAEVLNNIVPRFLQDGWQVNVHAIGDRANGIVLDSFETALKKVKVDVAALRPRIEHVQIITKADTKRLAELGVIASIQPSHAISDMWYAQDRLGPERVKDLYAFRTILNSGARITLGTDFPVEEVNPLHGFVAALTRTATDGTSPHGPGGWFPEQRLTRQEALRGLTIDPAYASFTESILGSIERGKRADFVVLSQDIMTVPVGEILKTEVLATVIDGKPAYGHL